MSMTTDLIIVNFVEKPKDPPGMPDKPEMALASMGIYVFETEFLFEQLRRDAADLGFEPRFRQGHHPLALSSTAKPGAHTAFTRKLRAFRA